MKVKSTSYAAVMLTGTLLLSGCWFSCGDTCNETTPSLVTDENVVVNNGGLKVINVLDAQYFDDAHIPGSINISLADLADKSADWDKATQLVVYCADYKCAASAQAAKKLMDLGFTNVKAYEAGMAAWNQAGLPVEGPAAEGYLVQENNMLETRNHSDVSVISTEELKNLIDGIENQQ